LSEGVRQIELVPFLARLAAEAGDMTGIAGVLLTTLHNPVEVAEHRSCPRHHAGKAIDASRISNDAVGG
jgi:hypothetical protein